MTYQLRDFSGSLFKNEQKDKETHADYNGTAIIEGRAYYVNAWIKRCDGKNPFMSLAFKLKEQKSKPQQAQKPTPAPPIPPKTEEDKYLDPQESDDDIPF